MSLSTLFTILMFVVSIAMIIVLLLQARGSAGNIFGPSEGSSYRSRRGLEQLLFRSTVGLGVLFVVIAILNVRYA
jgi:protein translocase SecG subunit